MFLTFSEKKKNQVKRFTLTSVIQILVTVCLKMPSLFLASGIILQTNAVQGLAREVLPNFTLKREQLLSVQFFFPEASKVRIY